MSTDSKLPLALYKANLELLLRIGALLHENRRRWANIGVGASHEAMEHTLRLTERMLTANDWASLAALPGEQFWRSLGVAHTALEIPVEQLTRSQSDFAAGLKLALEQWQQQSADAMSGSQTTSHVPQPDTRKAGKASQGARASRRSRPTASRAETAAKPPRKTAPRPRSSAKDPRKR